MGATVHITTLPGYLPKIVPEKLVDVYRRNATTLVGQEEWWEPSFGAGSTDLGDVSHLMPAIEAQANGCCGTGHGADYAVRDADLAYIAPAKVAAMTLIDLLVNDGAGAKEVLEGFEPAMTKDRYLDFMRDLAQDVTWPMEED